MGSRDADQKNATARRYANRPRSRLLDDPVVFNVVGTIGLILFVGVLALWALARFVRDVASRLVHASRSAHKRFTPSAAASP
jgi:hypothetical protein